MPLIETFLSTHPIDALNQIFTHYGQAGPAFVRALVANGLSTLYQDLLGGSYDCVDRIVLNAYFRMGHSPGGFRVWWRALAGSYETLQKRLPDAPGRPVQPSHSRLW